tara:strand:+ start:444 stop:1040 length:597 start_codon:yes stop_codon:yes gene_type:complete
MIQFKNLNQGEPYLLFKSKYDEAYSAGQKVIEAISISTFENKTNEVDSRFVNLKFVSEDEFIFFSNYKSPKANSFETHSQVAALIYWSSINVQIRMKAKIRKMSNDYNQRYFENRSKKKNALAISSDQSKPIDSYKQVIENYNKSLNKDDLKKCPEYWGGYSFTPYYFEFWEGHELRLNKREIFEKIDGCWRHSFVQP